MMNNTFSDIVELLHIRANQEPLGIAYTFLLMDKEDEFKPVNVTYQQLEQQAQAIAVNLKSILKPGQRTLMFYPAGLEFISAFLDVYMQELWQFQLIPHEKITTSVD